MIIIGVITIALLIPLQSAPRNSSINNSSLGANAYNADYSGSESNSIFGTSSSKYPYQPVIIRSYPTSNTTYSGSTDSYTYTTTTTTTTSGQNPNNTYYYGSSGYNSYQGYVPAGCENGTDYSLTTEEPCG